MSKLLCPENKNKQKQNAGFFDYARDGNIHRAYTFREIALSS
jgi:hypothetical protein